MNKKIFSIIIFLVVILVSSSVFLLFKKNVGGFDSLFVSQGDCTPFNLFVAKGVEEFSAKITWKTKGKCMGFVQYGLNRDSLDKVGLDFISGYRSQDHEVLIEKLLTKERYYYLINSNGQGYGNNGRPLELVLMNL